MAKCKRCGAIFDYDKKEGVCPRCCFYNRPPGSPHHDDEWLSSYNIEDNTYQLPKQSDWMEDEPESIWRKKRPKYKTKISNKKDCDTEGSHVHTHTKPKTRADYKKREEPPEGKAPGRLLFILIAAVVILFILFLMKSFFQGISFHHISFRKDKNPPVDQEFVIDQMEVEDLMKGARIGDMTYSTVTPGAVVLFEEGELPELRSGEMCVGIQIADDESSLGYSGIYWKRPYVFDGTNYRELVDGTLMNAKKIDQQMGIEFMKEFLSDQKDFDGVAAYFVDKDTDSVTLCIPDQTVDGDNVRCSGVVEVQLPVIRRQQEGGTDSE